MLRLVSLFHRYKTKLALMKISATQVVISFLTNILILRSIGLGGELDVFYIGMSVFAFLYTSINWSIASILAPYLIDVRAKGKEGALFISVLCMVIPIAIFVYFTMPFWVEYLYVNYLDTVEYSKIIMVQSLLILAYVVDGFMLVYVAMLQEKNRYITLNLSMLFASFLGLIFVYLTLDSLGIYAAAMNQLLMKIIILCCLLYMFLPQIIKTISFDAVQLKLIFNRSKYLLFGSLYYRTDEVVERYIASYLTGGFVSLISFVQRVYGAVITVLNSAIGLPSITVFSNLVKDKKYQEIRPALMKYIGGLFAVSAVLFFIIFFLGEWLFTVVIGTSLSAELQPILRTTILCLFVFVVGKPIALVLQSLLLSLKKGTVATAYDSVAYTISVTLKIALTVQFGINGFLAAIIFTAIVMDGSKMYLVFKELEKFEK